MSIWARLGVSVAFCAGFYILMTGVLHKTAQFQAYKMQWIIGLVCGGALLALLGLVTGNRGSQPGGRSANSGPEASNAEGTDGSHSGGGAFLSLPYCGCMLMVFGLITLTITPAARQQALALARAVTAQPRPGPTAMQPAAPSSPIPALKLQGIIYRPANPSAVINGQPVFQGESIAGATVKAITPGAVIVAWGGNEVVLSLSGCGVQASPKQ